MLVMLEKHNEYYINVVLSMLGLIKQYSRTHINECDGVKNIKNLMFLNTSLDDGVTASDHCDININIVKDNIRMINSHRNWNLLLYKEAIKIEGLKPLLNISWKA